MSSEKHVALFFKQGSSDKEYHVHLVKSGSGYLVKIEYGRRGSSLTASQKTPVPVDLDKATEIFEAQVHSKLLKGYTKATGQAPYVGGDKENKITGILPQLLNNIEKEELDGLFDDSSWCMQEKKDGKRMLFRRSGEVLEAINRKGLLVGFPQAIQDRFSCIEGDFLVDGELIGEVVWLFDILERQGTNLRAKGYVERHAVLLGAFGEFDKNESAVQLIYTTFGATSKRKAFKALEKKGVEGVVFKRISAPYSAGRPNSGGDQRKFKFKQTATVQVSNHNEKGKRSVYIQCLEGKELVDVGKVTVLPNFPMPEVGTLVEIEYLYRHIHGALYQPVYLGERTDLDYPDQVSTLKVKEGVDIDEEDF